MNITIPDFLLPTVTRAAQGSGKEPAQFLTESVQSMVTSWADAQRVEDRTALVPIADEILNCPDQAKRQQAIDAALTIVRA